MNENYHPQHLGPWLAITNYREYLIRQKLLIGWASKRAELTKKHMEAQDILGREWLGSRRYYLLIRLSWNQFCCRLWRERERESVVLKPMLGMHRRHSKWSSMNDIYRIQQTFQFKERIITETRWGHSAQLLKEGPKYMQMGGLILKIERIADGIVQMPSPHIKPEATAPA